VQLLMFSASKEDLVFSEALAAVTPQSMDDKETTSSMIGLTFEQMREEVKKMQTDPKQRQQVQMLMQQQLMAMPVEQRQYVLDQMMESLTPEQKAAAVKQMEMQQALIKQAQATASMQTASATTTTTSDTNSSSISLKSSAPSTVATPSVSVQQQQILDQMQQFQQTEFSHVQQPYDASNF